MTPAQTAACIAQLPTETLALVDKLFAPGLTREKLLSKILRSEVCEIFTTYGDDGWREDHTPSLTTHIKFEIKIPLGQRFTWEELKVKKTIEKVEPDPTTTGHRVTLKEGYMAKMGDTIFWSPSDYSYLPESRVGIVESGDVL